MDAFAEAEALVDEFGPRPPGSDAERRAGQHLCRRLEELGREAHTEAFSVWPAWAPAYAINAGIAIVGSVVSVSSATLGTGLVLLATILTFLDLAGITPTTRRLLGRRASQNVVSWGDRDTDGALILRRALRHRAHAHAIRSAPSSSPSSSSSPAASSAPAA